MRQKPRPSFLLSVFSCLSMLILILSACSASGTPSNTSSTTNNGKPVRGGTWIDDIPNEPDSLIPNGSSQTFSALVDEALYSPLFVGDTSGKINPYLATEIPTTANGDVSSDLKTWKFKLKPGLKWSDGQPLTADDVDFTWRTWTNKNFGAGSTSGLNLIDSATVSPDKLSITFHLKQPYAPFLSAWTDGQYAPMPKHHFASMDVAAILKSKDNLDPSVTSGPFTMSESVPGNHYTLVRNPNYFQAAQGLPYLDKIIFRPILNETTILNDFKSGAITSSWFLDVSETDAYKSIPKYTFVTNPNAANFEYMVINFQNPILGKYLEVRKAMAMAIDHATLIKVARKGQAVPLCTDHGQSMHPGYEPNAPCPTYDPAAANKLLDQNGWVKGPDGIRSKNGMRLEFKYSTTTGKPWRLADEEILQQDFQAIGIKLDIQNYPASTFFGPFLNSGKHDLAEYENSFTYDPNDSSIISCDQIPSRNGGFGENRSWYCNPQVDQLLQKEQSSDDPNVRQDAFNQLHQIYLTDFPFIVLYSPADPALVKNTAHNYLPGPMGASETVNVWKWWCTNGTC
jgi:peptide/nickel transport system substrate-binding protein